MSTCVHSLIKHTSSCESWLRAKCSFPFGPIQIQELKLKSFGHCSFRWMRLNENPFHPGPQTEKPFPRQHALYYQIPNRKFDTGYFHFQPQLTALSIHSALVMFLDYSHSLVSHPLYCRLLFGVNNTTLCCITLSN